MEENKNNPETEKITAALEAILFIYGEPLEFKKALALLGTEKEKLSEAYKSLERSLDAENRGLTLVYSGDYDRAQLATKADFSPLAAAVLKSELSENLTSAAIDALTIVCYAGPVSRAEIDYIRGVNSGFILRSLMIRGLIDRIPHPQKGNAVLYQPSFELLKLLGVGKAERLPEYQKFRDIFKITREKNGEE